MANYEVITEKGAVPIKAWTRGVPVEDAAVRQLLNTARLPFIHKWMAAMPDVHLGKGATVGSVIPTRGAIVPAAVGVDIGCFVGETLVPLADGKHYPIRELAESGREIIAYACTPTQRIVAARATAKCTRRNAELIKVTLDNGEEIRCTPDHRFMLRDGSYVEARDLAPGSSLMPLYTRSDKDGSTLIQQPDSGRWQKAQWIVARSGMIGQAPCFPTRYHSSHKARAKSRELAHQIHGRETSGEEARSSIGLPNHRRYQQQSNHKVVSVEPLAEREDVYCLTVPEYGNFALSAGVFVHNCGMVAARTTLKAEDLPDSLAPVRTAIEQAVPHGRGAWQTPPAAAAKVWRSLQAGYDQILKKYPKLDHGQQVHQLGTLGTGNHFVEICLDEEQRVWVMLHSGSRGVGNRIGSFFIELAKQDMRRHFINLPDQDLAYLVEGTEHFDDYWFAVAWAQDYAAANRELMLANVVGAVVASPGMPPFRVESEIVNCHHNYVALEHHYGADVYVTRKGAVRARAGELGIIPGSMGAKSFIVRGKGNPESFESCSHGAGRVMSRGEAKRRLTIEEHAAATAGVECRKDAGVIDESPRAYKPIESVLAAQSDLVEVVHTLKQVVCVKG